MATEACRQAGQPWRSEEGVWGEDFSEIRFAIEQAGSSRKIKWATSRGVFYEKTEAKSGQKREKATRSRLKLGIKLRFSKNVYIKKVDK